MLRQPPSGSGNFSGLLQADSRTSPTGSIAENLLVTSKILSSPKGIVYSFKQQQLQKKNPVKETRLYDPSSPLRTAAFGLKDRPAQGITRHAGEKLRGLLQRLKEKATNTRFGEVTGDLWKQAPSFTKDFAAIGIGAAAQDRLFTSATAVRFLEQGANTLASRFLGGATYDPEGGPESEGKEKRNLFNPGNPYWTEEDGFGEGYQSILDRTETKEEPEPKPASEFPTIQRRPDGPDFGAPNHGALDEDGNKVSRIDKINALPPMKGEDLFREDFDGHKDVVPFRILDLNNDTLLVFRSFIEGISDSPEADWSPHEYAGRPEKAYTYSGYSNTISFNLKLVSFSPEEQRQMWEKANYLKSLMAPSYYSGGRYMVPPFLRMTLSDLYRGIYGYISSLSLDFNDDAGWEIDPELGRLPRMIEASITWQVIERRLPMAYQKMFDAPFLDPRSSSSPYSGFESSGENDDNRNQNLR